MLEAQKRKSRKITKVTRKNDSLYLESEHGILRLSPKSCNIIRISYKLGSLEPVAETGIGISYDENIYDWDFDESNEYISLRTSELIVSVDRETASIVYNERQEGQTFLAEREKESRIMEEFDSFKTVIDESTEIDLIQTADGLKRSIKSSNKVFDKKLYRTWLHLDFYDTECLYGLGQAEEGMLNLRATTQYIHQANMKSAVPFLLSSRGYGILLATGSPVIFNDTEFGSYLYTEADIQMDYYFIGGDFRDNGADSFDPKSGSSFDKIIKGYRLLTGKAVMLPKWAFGYVQCQERYESAEEIIDVVKEYRRRGIGLDCIVLDWMSWLDGHWGQKTFDPARFPDPKKMMENLHAMNARLMISLWPNMDEKTDNYREFNEKNLLLPANTTYDAFNEEARKLYWKQVNEGLFAHGLDAWWCDSSEMVTPEWNREIRPEASKLHHMFFEEASNFMPAEKCNAFCLAHAQTIYEGQRSSTEDKRVCNLTRSGYTGQQKYGTILWSGDISAKWETLEKQIAAGLNFCASGLPYWTLDIGAFFVKQGTEWFWDGEYESGCDDLGYRELYTRWFQYGAFLPIFRAHGTDVRREIWKFGEPGEMFYDALVKTVELRYQLLPYIYSLAADAWYNDGTMMRMFAFDFPHDTTALEITDQFMFGKSIMVCPITYPMYYEAGSVSIDEGDYSWFLYLPYGYRWYDFWTNQVYDGGAHISVDADISKIPLFVREGSIIPFAEPANYVDEKRDKPIELLIYPGCDAEFMYYDDAGDGYMYESGEYSLTRILWDDSAKKVTYEKIKESDKIKPAEFVVRIIEGK